MKGCFARLKKFFWPLIVQAFCDPLATAQSRDTFLATQTRQNNTDLFLSWIAPRGLTTDVLYQFICSIFAAKGFLSHLHSMKVTINQKSSSLNSANMSQWPWRQTRINISWIPLLACADLTEAHQILTVRDFAILMFVTKCLDWHSTHKSYET